MKKADNTIYGHLEILLIITAIVVMAVVMAWISKAEIRTITTGIEEVSDGWYYVENGERVELSLPAVMEVEQGQAFVIYNDSLSEEAGKTITTRAAVYELCVFYEEQLLYEYEDGMFPRNTQMKSKMDCDAQLPNVMQDGTVSLVYSDTENGLYEIPAVYIGSGAEVLTYHYKQMSAVLVIVFFMAVLALISITIPVYLRQIHIYDHRFIDVAIFLIICGIWCVTDSSLAQYYSSNSAVVRVVSFYAFMLLAVPMLHFVRDMGQINKNHLIDWITAAFYVNAIVQGILNYLRVFEFIEMLFVTHLLLTGGVIVLTILMLREYRKNKNRELRTMLLGFVTVGTGGVLAMLLYWLFEIPYYDAIFECGILIFVILLLRSIIITVVGNIRVKTEMAAYKRLAKEDGLTGMPNRRSFEEFITSFQMKANDYANALLVFLDLNTLRGVNDEYGYNVGDELIVATAKCIENAYGDKGTCYRIGGDEFCAIILNPEGTEREWKERLDKEIRDFNSESRYRLSVSSGFSYLRDEDGFVKTISEWKYQANEKLNESKGGKKKNVSV